MNILFSNSKEERISILVLGILFLLSACTSSRYASQKITEAENAIEEIEQIEAMNFAQSEFSAAQTKLEDARQLHERGKHKKAILKAREAEVAAELAETKTLSQKTGESIERMKASIKSLKERLAEYREQE